MRRREFLEAGAFTSLVGLTTGCAARKTTAAAAPSPLAAGERDATTGARSNQPGGPSDLVGTGHSNDCRPSPASRFGLCPEARAVRYQDRGPRLRLRWCRDVVGLGLRGDGRRHRIATGRA